MKKELRQLCRRVGKDVFCRGVKNAFVVSVLALILATISCLFSACGKQEAETIVVHEVRTQGITYQTSRDNPRIKVPVETETTYLVFEGGTLAWK